MRLVHLEHIQTDVWVLIIAPVWKHVRVVQCGAIEDIRWSRRLRLRKFEDKMKDSTSIGPFLRPQVAMPHKHVISGHC